MKHLGDITELRGGEIPVVDIITGGSPCQDLSAAGLRKGIKHESNGDEETTRSGLFMDQLRIVKEMRQRERENGRTGFDVRPRYMVWENVPGAFSSNGGKDFQAVLTEIVRVAQPDAPDVPMPEKGGWSKAGCLYGEMGDWSVAYRVHDAQYWGVPQRRKRICVLADFNGLSAPEILFDAELRGTAPDTEPHEAERDSGTERGRKVSPVTESLSGDSEPGGAAGEGTAKAPAGRSDGASQYGAISIQGNTIDRTPKQNGGGGISLETAHTLNSTDRHDVSYAVDCRNGRENPFVNGTLQSKKQGMNVNNNNIVRVPMKSTPQMKTAESSLPRKSDMLCAEKQTIHSGKTLRPTSLLPQTSGTDLKNGRLTWDVANTLTANTGQSASRAGPSVLTTFFSPAGQPSRGEDGTTK